MLGKEWKPVVHEVQLAQVNPSYTILSTTWGRGNIQYLFYKTKKKGKGSGTLVILLLVVVFFV